MGFSYQQDARTLDRIIVWTCDVFGCRHEAVGVDDGQPVCYLRPPDWSTVLVTSMTDGDYAYVQCPTHTTDLHRRFHDGADVTHNLQSVGWRS